MPIYTDKVEIYYHVAVSGTVRAEPDAPVQYSSVKDRKFRPEEWSIKWYREEGKEWRLDHWNVRGPVLTKDGRATRRVVRWHSGGYREEISDTERQAFPWLEAVINANRPKES